MAESIRRIVNELKHHVPFTFFGAFISVIIMLIAVLGNLLEHISPISENIFYILHPTHILMSALVTTTLYVKYGKRKISYAILIGYTGSIGIATISDSIIPYIGEYLLNLPNTGLHIGLIEEPLLTNPPAIIGTLIGYWKGMSEFPHAGHVLISTWASLFHIIMALGTSVDWIQTIIIFIFLFLAVWLPCCTSDIVYPLLFLKKPSSRNHHV
jgi:hypothetical protein